MATTGTDHPRGRGEHAYCEAYAHDGRGSSPRARGTHPRRGSQSRRPRIIPAGAGNTARPARRAGGGTDHPRGRGEHSSDCYADEYQHGSSPRARGTRGRVPSRGRTGPDHPRGRGEHSIPGYFFERVRGSSPRARGTPGRGSTPLNLSRIIPAGAGNTPGART